MLKRVLLGLAAFVFLADVVRAGPPQAAKTAFNHGGSAETVEPTCVLLTADESLLLSAGIFRIAATSEQSLDPDAIAKEIRAVFPATIDGEYECWDKLKTEIMDRLLKEYEDTASRRTIPEISLFAAVYVCEPVSPQAHAFEPACMAYRAFFDTYECYEAEDNSKDWWFQFARTHPQIVEEFRQ